MVRFVKRAICPIRLRSRRRIQVLLDCLEPRTLLSADITQYRYDPLSTGQNQTEVVLTPANVNATDFGRQFITQLDGQVYAQTLAMANVNITRGTSPGIHNVLYVATMHDSLFAIDADTGAILWQDSFLQILDPRVTTPLSPAPTAGVIPFPQGTTSSSENAGVNANDVAPEEGVFGTPVIDPVTHIIYLISYAQERRNDTPTTSTPSASGSDWHFVERLWALNISDGSVAITPTAPVGAPVPASGGQTFGDTVLNPTTGSLPPFSNFAGYQYYAGPYIKATGENGGSTPTADGWATNPNDLVSNASHSIFAGTTPTAQGYIALNALLQPTRTGLMILNGIIYFGMTSHGDNGPYYGWLYGFSATTLQNVSAFVTTPSYESYNVISGSAASSSSKFDAEGAIWGGQQSITTDGTYLYFTVGNGSFDWTGENFNATNVSSDEGNTVQLPIDGDYGNTVMKVAVDPAANQTSLDIHNLPTTFNPHGQNVNGYGIRAVDFFAPSDILDLNKRDQDLGSVGILLLPNNVTSTVPGHIGDPMLVSGNKSGRVYLLDRNNLGGFNRGIFNADDVHYINGTLIFKAAGSPTLYTDSPAPPDQRLYDRALGEFTGMGSLFTIPTFYMNGTTPTLIFNGNGNAIHTFNLNTFQYTTGSPPTTSVNPPVLASSTTTFSNHGSLSALSANNGANAIVWNVNSKRSTATDDLLAFGIGLGAPIYDSNTNAAADSLTGQVTNATATKFSQPSDFNGMVYIGTSANWSSSGTTQIAFAQGAIVGYGLRTAYLASNSAFFSAPSALSGRYQSGTGNILTWINNATLETHARIERSTNGTAWTVLAFVDNGVSTYTDATVSAGQTFFYRILGINGANVTAPTAAAQIVATPPGLLSALSRKTQGAAGDFDIALPLTGTAGVESRSGGPTKILLTFDRTLNIANTTLVLSSGTGTMAVAGAVVTITMSGATDGQTLTITLNNVADLTSGASANFSLSVGVLLGDVNGNGHVNSNDYTIVGSNSGTPVTAANFRSDVNGNGLINSNDVTITGANSGHDLAATPAFSFFIRPAAPTDEASDFVPPPATFVPPAAPTDLTDVPAETVVPAVTVVVVSDTAALPVTPPVPTPDQSPPVQTPSVQTPPVHILVFADIHIVANDVVTPPAIYNATPLPAATPDSLTPLAPPAPLASIAYALPTAKTIIPPPPPATKTVKIGEVALHTRHLIAGVRHQAQTLVWHISTGHSDAVKLEPITEETL